ncbi:hypothetical protein Bcav_0493 [Beutenbergia cavernae DSM 12333]|uniref:DinB-like domain-containing protein n=1 Tax=Beutenbergia cavernae (strain ATCC BAA-8 / DSM 12333 / CCUG 43141 / JCM 11478 / NBRC 16432 / NCIMB 13614 / HKI 0122) TaxID=471853 RepID=C5BX81_BEUC1|nr:DinB family protein [Beutenbergia cavernae]ACQ78756.1 hypothetical protein Bcav_0493 [Beutenbergia cavernae DSM 12333]
MRVAVYVDPSAGMAHDGWASATTFDLAAWGVVGQGPDDGAALADLSRRLTDAGVVVDPAVVERLEPAPTGTERLFGPELLPATPEQRVATQAVLDDVRPRTLALLDSLGEAELDREDPERDLPAWAAWRTLRAMFWHIADCETRYYLACLGIPAPPRLQDLRAELVASAAAVREAVATMPADLVVDVGAEGRWSTVKVLRRLAWHERDELVAMTALAARARGATA